MKRFRISENTKRTLGILNKICLAILAFTFLSLVDIWLIQDKTGNFNVADFEKQINGNDLTVSDFEDTVEAALLRKSGQIDAYQCTIDEEIFRMRNDDYMVIYYRAVGTQEEAFIYANYRVIEQDNVEKYGLVNVQVEVRSPMNESNMLTAREHICYQTALALENFINYANDKEDENSKPIAYGDICEDCFAEGENIYNLQIDGQCPDEIVEYECLGKKYYFWYYDRLKTDKTISEELITLTENEEKDCYTPYFKNLANQDIYNIAGQFADSIRRMGKGYPAAMAVRQDGHLKRIKTGNGLWWTIKEHP